MNICGECGRFLDCSWEREFKPVPGWTAKKVKLTGCDFSYDIKKCPLFKPAAKRKMLLEEYTRNKNREPVKVYGRKIGTAEVKTWPSMKAAERDGFIYAGVERASNGVALQHRGWVFWKDGEEPKGDPDYTNRVGKSIALVGYNASTGDKVMFESYKDARRHGFSEQGIRDCIRGKRETSRGYVWHRA